MPEQKDKGLLIPIYYGKEGVPVTGLTDITVVVFKFNASGSSQIDTGGASEIGGGFYGYVVDSSKVDANAEYLYNATTAAGDVDEATVAGRERVGQDWIEHMDADISSLLGAVAADRPSGTTANLTAHKNNTLLQSITELGDLTGWEEIYFTMKLEDAPSGDTNSAIQVSKDDGLEIIAGEAAGTPGNGSITINDETLGNITIFVDEVEMAKIEARIYDYDVKIIRASGQKVITLADGRYTITETATEKIT